MKEMQERNFTKRLKNRAPDENLIDIALSGTTATLVIQTSKKLYTAYVGDSSVVVGKRDRKLTTTVLT